MKIAKYIKDGKEHTTVLYTGIHISLCELTDIVNCLDKKKVNENNRQLFLYPFEEKNLRDIREILKTKNEKDTASGWHYGSFLGLEIFLLGEETEISDDYVKVMSKNDVEHYLFRMIDNERDERRTGNILLILFVGILLTIIITTLILKI